MWVLIISNETSQIKAQFEEGEAGDSKNTNTIRNFINAFIDKDEDTTILFGCDETEMGGDKAGSIIEAYGEIPKFHVKLQINKSINYYPITRKIHTLYITGNLFQAYPFINQFKVQVLKLRYEYTRIQFEKKRLPPFLAHVKVDTLHMIYICDMKSKKNFWKHYVELDYLFYNRIQARKLVIKTDMEAHLIKLNEHIEELELVSERRHIALSMDGYAIYRPKVKIYAQYKMNHTMETRVVTPGNGNIWYETQCILQVNEKLEQEKKSYSYTME